MNDKTKLVNLEDVSMEKAPVIYKAGGLDVYINLAKEQVDEVPDLTTAKGRKRIASLSASVSTSKVAVEKVGREYLKEIKAKPREIEKELKKFVDAMNELRDKTRQPLTLWEEEQEQIRIKEEEERQAEELKKQVESDHEMALLMDDKYERDLADRIAEEVRIERERQEALKKEAAEREERIRKEAAEAAERAKFEAEEREKLAKEAEAKAKQDAIESEERRKREAEEAEKRRVAEAEAAENRRIEAEAHAAEQARLAEVARQEAEVRRQAEEKAAREANVENRRAKNNAAKEALIQTGITEEQAITIIKAIASGMVPNVTINY
jgi:colicin import membrane protein